MATSRYYSDEDEATGGAAGGVLTGGGGGGGAAPAAAPSSGSGFVNLSKYLDANRGGTGQIADKLAGDVGSQVGASNEALAGATTSGMSAAQGLDTSGIGAGSDLSAGAEQAALSGIADYGMGAGAEAGFMGIGQGQEDIRGYGTGLVDEQHTRQEAIQRLYGSGRGSGFGALDSFLVAADDTSGLGGKVQEQVGQLGDVAAGQQQVQGAYDTANQQRATNTTAQYQASRETEAAAEAQRQAEAQADLEARAPGPNPMGGIAGSGGSGTSAGGVFAETGGLTGSGSYNPEDSPFASTGGMTGATGATDDWRKLLEEDRKRDGI